MFSRFAKKIEIKFEEDSLYISSSKSTPEIRFVEGKLEMTGESFPEDASTFFQPVLVWLELYKQSTYVKNPENMTYFISHIDYFNTGSRPFILEVIKQLNDIHIAGHPIKIKWYYDGDLGIDEDDVNFAEMIEDFRIQIDYIPKKVIK